MPSSLWGGRDLKSKAFLTPPFPVGSNPVLLPLGEGFASTKDGAGGKSRSIWGAYVTSGIFQQADQLNVAI